MSDQQLGTVVIGGSQAGLAVGYVDHIVSTHDGQKKTTLWPERQPLGGSMRNGFVSVLVVFAGLSHAALSA